MNREPGNDALDRGVFQRVAAKHLLQAGAKRGDQLGVIAELPSLVRGVNARCEGLHPGIDRWVAEIGDGDVANVLGDEDDTRQANFYRAAVFQFGDRVAVGVVVLGHVPVAMAEDQDVSVALANVVQAALADRVAVGHIAVLGLVIGLHQPVDDGLALGLQVEPGGRDIDFSHAIPIL